MTQANDSYDWEEILERLDVNFGDFPDMATLINRLDEVLLSGFASAHQIDLSIAVLQQQLMRAIDTGFIVTKFERRGATVTQLRDARGRFVASTEIGLTETRSITRRRVGDISAALRRGAG